jgi:predicted peroxiredoxin
MELSKIYVSRESVHRVWAKPSQEFYCTEIEIPKELERTIYAVQEAASILSRRLEEAAQLCQTRRPKEAIDCIEAGIKELLDGIPAPPPKKATVRKRTKTEGAK